jgi:hypothetical protein
MSELFNDFDEKQNVKKCVYLNKLVQSEECNICWEVDNLKTTSVCNYFYEYLKQKEELNQDG